MLRLGLKRGVRSAFRRAAALAVCLGMLGIPLLGFAAEPSSQAEPKLPRACYVQGTLSERNFKVVKGNKQFLEAYTFPGAVASLRPHCSTVLECAALSSELPLGHGSDSKLALYLEHATDTQKYAACERAKTCYAAAAELCRVESSRSPRAEVLFHPGWRPNAWVVELAAHLESRHSIAIQDDAPHPRGMRLHNHLRKTLGSQLDIAVELGRQVYGLSCDSAVTCLKAFASDSGWAEERRWHEEVANPERQAMLAQAAGTLVIEDALKDQNAALREQAVALEKHGQALSEGIQITGVTVADTTLQATISDKDPAVRRNTAGIVAKPSQAKEESDGDLNLTDATLLLNEATHRIADKQDLIAQNLHEGLAHIGDSILIAANVRQQGGDGVIRQVDPEADFASIYPNARTLGYAILLVPDPRIPRHRRGYDLTLSAISQGMLDDGYVLDRYAMPWQKYLDDVSSGGKTGALEASGSDDGRYGVLIYRKDLFRQGELGGATGTLATELRVLYVVAESGSYGVQQNAFERALLRIERVLLQDPNRLAETNRPPVDSLCDGLMRTGYEPSPRGAGAKHERLHYAGTHFYAIDDGRRYQWSGTRLPLFRTISALRSTVSAQLPQDLFPSADFRYRVLGPFAQELLAPLLTSLAPLSLTAGSYPASTLVIGPNFSGSISSIADARMRAVDRLDKGDLGTAKDIADLRKLIGGLLAGELSQSHQRAELARARSTLQKRFELMASDAVLDREELEELSAALGREPWATTQVAGNAESLSKSVEMIRVAIAKQRRWTGYCSALSTTDKRKQQGSIESAATDRLPLRLVSAATTASSNYRASTAPIAHHSLAVPDSEKLKFLHARFPPLCNTAPCAKRDVVIFSETSTFGAGLCATRGNGQHDLGHDPLCARAYEIRFPANIADIRARAQGRQREAQKQALDALGLPSSESALDLAQGAENGSEFPDSQRSALTTASAERMLLGALRQVEALRPRLVIVAATDVRDRLFLFDRLRSAAPRALLVDMEADVLMAHPSIIHASRGMLVLSSGRLDSAVSGTCCTDQGTLVLHNFVSDDQWALHRIVVGLGSVSESCPSGQSCLVKAQQEFEPRLYGYTPTKQGLKLALQAQSPLRFGKEMPWLLGSADPRPWRVWSLVLIPFSLGAMLFWIQRKGKKDDELVAQVGGSGQGLMMVVGSASVFAAFVWLGAAFATDPSGKVPNAHLYSLTSGYSYGAALAILASVCVLLYYLNRVVRGCRSVRVNLGAQGADRPILIAETSARREVMPGADVVAWPLYLVSGYWLWVVAASTQFSPCILCWPKTSLLSGWLELLLLMGVMLLSGIGLLAGLHAFRAFQRLQGIAGRVQLMVCGDSSKELSCWSTLPATQVSEQTEDGTRLGKSVSGGANSRLAWLRPRFARTPFLARPGDFAWPYAVLNSGGQTNIAGLRSVLAEIHGGYVDSVRSRLALGIVFATLTAELRLCMLGAMLALLGVVGIGYAYPVTDRDAYLIFALVVLALIAVLGAYVVLALERLPVVSRLLCNTKAGLDLNWPTVVSIVSPFLAVLAVLFVIEIPGVLGASEGVIRRLLGLVGL